VRKTERETETERGRELVVEREGESTLDMGGDREREVENAFLS